MRLTLLKLTVRRLRRWLLAASGLFLILAGLWQCGNWAVAAFFDLTLPQYPHIIRDHPAVASPDGQWSAMLQEDIDPNTFVVNYVDKIYLIPRSDPGRRLLAFVGTNGDAGLPTLAWDGPDTLRIEMHGDDFECASVQNWNELGLTITFTGRPVPRRAEFMWPKISMDSCYG